MLRLSFLDPQTKKEHLLQSKNLKALDFFIQLKGLTDFVIMEEFFNLAANPMRFEWREVRLAGSHYDSARIIPNQIPN